jgi:hypothetical protein
VYLTQALQIFREDYVVNVCSMFPLRYVYHAQHYVYHAQHYVYHAQQYVYHAQQYVYHAQQY